MGEKVFTINVRCTKCNGEYEMFRNTYFWEGEKITTSKCSYYNCGGTECVVIKTVGVRQ